MALKDSLISHWKLEEASGTRVDAHTSGNDLTDNNTVLQGTGIIGSCADYEKTNNEDLSITDASQTGLDITGDFSFSGWFNVEELASVNARQGMFGKSESVGSQRSYSVSYEETDKLTLRTYEDGTTSPTVAEVTDAAYFVSGDVGNWVYFAVSYDLSSGTTVFYKNGSSVASTKTGTTITGIFDGTAPFELGDYNSGSEFDGLVDECSIWSRIITSSEVSEIYNSGSGLAFDDWDVVAATFIQKAIIF